MKVWLLEWQVAGNSAYWSRQKMQELLRSVDNYMFFFGLDGVIEGEKITSLQKNEQNSPYFELSIENDGYVIYSINLSKNKVYTQNIPVRDKRDYCILFRLLRIDFESVQNAINNGSNEKTEVIL